MSTETGDKIRYIRKKRFYRNFYRLARPILTCLICLFLLYWGYQAIHWLFPSTGSSSSSNGNDNSPEYDYRKYGGSDNVMDRLRSAAGMAHKHQHEQDELENDNNNINSKQPKMGAFFMGHPRNIGRKRIDWHDYSFIESERARFGAGEHGSAAHVPADMEARRAELFEQNGFNGLLSDMISLNRSVADIRHKDCTNVKYLSELPTVSVIIPFYNEHWTTLLRTCYSVLNRSPRQLINEIILVDDNSDKGFLKDQLDEYVAENLPKVKIVRLPERSGLIVARIAGAKAAISDVLLFLDSHCEVNTNWLPPLLEPIAENYRICMCPFIDVIAYDTFEYRAQDDGGRGAFDWQFFYKRLPRLASDAKHPIRPFKSPVMAGGLFAISAKFFWELGGYDEGLDIWGGEQYELSFKIWQCGGEMYDAPCSRVGHIYRGSTPFTNPRTTDYLHKNYKRVAEVWMDEYKEYLYKRDPVIYSSIDAGDLTKQLALRKNLQCKSFKWFMTEVAFDLEAKYPPIEPPDFAYGIIKSIAHPLLCVDTLGRHLQQEPGVYTCAENPMDPHDHQFFALTYYKDIRVKDTLRCFDVPTHGPNAPIVFYDCHMQQGNQGWRYHLDTKWLTIGSGGNIRCLDLNPIERKIFINKCDSANLNMQWEWGFANETALSDWDNYGAKNL